MNEKLKSLVIQSPSVENRRCPKPVFNTITANRSWSARPHAIVGT
jgi:hypothetical protein